MQQRGGFIRNPQVGTDLPTDWAPAWAMPADPAKRQISYGRRIWTSVRATRLIRLGDHSKTAGHIAPSGSEGGGSYGEHLNGGDTRLQDHNERITASEGIGRWQAQYFSGAHTFVAGMNGGSFGYQRPYVLQTPNDQNRRAPSSAMDQQSKVVTDPDWRF